MRKLLLTMMAGLSIQAFANFAQVTINPISPVIMTTDLVIPGNPDVVVTAPYFSVKYTIKANTGIEVQSIRVNVITPDGKKLQAYHFPLSNPVEMIAGETRSFDTIYVSDLPLSRELEYQADLTVIGRESTESKATVRDLATVFFDTW